jgi:hypothetical protein
MNVFSWNLSFTEVRQRIPNLVEVGHKQRILYMKTVFFKMVIQLRFQ